MPDNKTVLESKRERISVLLARVEVRLSLVTQLYAETGTDMEELTRMVQHVKALEAEEVIESGSTDRQ